MQMMNMEETMFSTLSKEYKQDILSEMLIAAKKVSGTEEVATKLQNIQVESWKNVHTPVDDVFTLLQLDKAGHKLFGSPEFPVWVKYVGREEVKTIFTTLSKHYPDDTLAQLLITAKQLSDEVFTRFLLDKAGHKLFNNPEFSLWSKYMDELKISDKEKTMISIMSDYYKQDVLSQMIISVKTNLAREAFATKLQNVQIENWKNVQTPVDDVFTRLQLHKARDKLFDNPEFTLWSKYLDDVKISDKEATMISTISGYYAQDVLSEMIITAKKVSGREDFATKLQTTLIENWKKAHAPANIVFTRLQLEKVGNKLFDIPEFPLWFKYAQDMGGWRNDEMIMLTLAAYYKENILTQLIVAAKKVSSTEDVATQMQAVQLRVWKSERTSTDKVFNLLQLNKAGKNLFDSPEFPVWIKYTDDLGGSSRERLMFSTLSRHYPDDVLSQIIIAAKKVSSTQDIATKVQEAQLRTWKKARTPIEDVFNFLQLNKAGDKLFAQPEFSVWIKYANDFGESTKYRTMLSTLSAYYKDDALTQMFIAARKIPSTEDLVITLQAERLRFRYKDVLYDEVFKAYKLNTPSGDLLTSPRLDKWASYVSKFNYENPSKKTTMVDTLTHYYGDENLAQMLIAAKGVEKTDSIATELQTMQIKYWLRMKENPQLVYNWMGIADRGSDDVERKIFEKFFTDPRMLEYLH
ncbi:Avirulence (Avh) protein [Phytophthora megakarya]|uniref:Avirulence (Avh) protein n=1 Tax=Phytophthora megakarya TaxID=4795 RepID=A0A225WM80_9STRA|nr:Avirulence (Avh) protein [Phytophthora megakarya]